ncbi:hypothetical protein P7K49_026483 [Saguinus oedipus]|uniref:Uncharacterized protein n=1 Tax=Saguinus oedipus TaxID=9490 RepID=A0ABQ9UDB7_SAGOE|nr:hypothetical protein P7K49_026483 [Saguinus oedipus]
MQRLATPPSLHSGPRTEGVVNGKAHSEEDEKLQVHLRVCWPGLLGHGGQMSAAGPESPSSSRFAGLSPAMPLPGLLPQTLVAPYPLQNQTRVLSSQPCSSSPAQVCAHTFCPESGSVFLFAPVVLYHLEQRTCFSARRLTVPRSPE